MIARKEKLFSIMKDDVTARVAGCGNDQQIVIELNRLFASYHLLDAKTRGAVVGMHQPFALESLVKECVSGDVVFVRQEHLTDAAQRFDSFDQLAREPRRIDENVSSFTRRPRD